MNIGDKVMLRLMVGGVDAEILDFRNEGYEVQVKLTNPRWASLDPKWVRRQDLREQQIRELDWNGGEQ